MLFKMQVAWLNVPSAILIVLLQRTPVVRAVAFVEEMVIASPLGSVLRSAIVATAAVGVHTIAGATELATSQPSPLNTTVGASVNVAFGITGTASAPERWFISGSVTPGLSFGGVTSGTIQGATLLLSGTPTTAGSFTMGLQANDDTGRSTPVYQYQVNVSSGSSTAPAFTTHPASQTVASGSSVTFAAAATGTPAPTFQWRKDGANIAGATASSYTINPVAPANAGTYSAVATNAAGSATSNAAVLTVQAGLVFTTHPASQFVGVGGSLTLTVSATGVGAVSYQWRKDGVAIAGATGTSFTINGAQFPDSGTYTAVATDSAGSASSNPATVTVSTSAPRLVNVSTRAFAGSGEATLIVGFVIGGTGSKTLIIRGVGPKLGSFGVPNVVANPSLVLFSGQNVIGQNDDWDASLAGDFNIVGAFALDAGSRDAAMKVTLPPGAYTIHLINTGPVAESLVEVYDLSKDPGTRLVNLSCRLRIAPGDTVIVGTVLQNASIPVIVRNIGPELGNFGVGGFQADPKLEVFSAQTVIASNNDWSPSLTPFFGAVGAFPLSVGSKDAATRLQLNPGSFTVHATGTGAAGIILVELYESP